MSNGELTISEWRKAIKERDKACKQCGSLRCLHAHHIIPVAEGGKCTLENGILLCKTCHMANHRKARRDTWKTAKRAVLATVAATPPDEPLREPTRSYSWLVKSSRMFTLDLDVAAALDEYLERHQVNASEFVNQLLAEICMPLDTRETNY